MTKKRPLVFIGVGIINTLLDFLFYTFLGQVIFRDQSSILLVGLISGTAALLVAFLTHSYITWRGRNISTKTVLKFFSVTGFGMWILRPLLLGLFIEFSLLYQWVYGITMHIGLPFSYGFIANTGAFGFMVIILLIYNYAAYDRFVFSAAGDDKTNTDRKNH